MEILREFLSAYLAVAIMFLIIAATMVQTGQLRYEGRGRVSAIVATVLMCLTWPVTCYLSFRTGRWI